MQVPKLAVLPDRVLLFYQLRQGSYRECTHFGKGKAESDFST